MAKPPAARRGLGRGLGFLGDLVFEVLLIGAGAVELAAILQLQP